uniref:ML domain-containing protein n=1 Tax=Strongyloides papillosus TaxID=174720 RepID=A0A0N5BLH3_STREA
MIFKNIQVFLLIILSDIICVETNNVRKKLNAVGLVDCKRLPVKNLQISLCQKNLNGFPNVLAKIPSYCQGNFQIKAYKSMFSNSDPYIMLTYKMSKGRGMDCKYKGVVPVPQTYLNKQMSKKLLYNFGIIDIKHIRVQEKKCYNSKTKSSFRRNFSLRRN